MSNDTDPELNRVLREIFSGGRIKQIKWSWDEPANAAFGWTLEERFKYACDLASSMNQAAKVLQEEKGEILKELDMARKKQEMAEELQDIDHRTLAESITKANDQQQSDAKIIRELQDRVRAQDAVIEALNADNS